MSEQIVRWRTVLAGVAAGLTFLGFLLPWWPSDFRDRSVSAGLEIMSENNWTIVSTYGSFGYVLHIPLALAAIWAVRQPGRWKWLAAAAVVMGLWQFIAVRGATLINTTFAAYLGFLAMFVLLGAFLIRDQRDRPHFG